MEYQGLPWWSSGKESALQCMGCTGLIPGQGIKIPHAAGQLSPRTTTTEPMRRKERSCMPQLRPDTTKKKKKKKRKKKKKKKK